MNSSLPKIENPLQLGGITTGSLDAPGPGGSTPVRAAFFETASGFRFTVLLDRGGDLLDARYNQFNLAYLSQNGLLPPNPAYNTGLEWLTAWPGGFLTTCGPFSIGGPRTQNNLPTSLHGRHSQQIAQIESITNPNPRQGLHRMELRLLLRDTRVYGPCFQIRRSLSATLGLPHLTIRDEVQNTGDTPTPHHWLYHFNFGFPLLDTGARFIYSGPAESWVVPPPPGQEILQPLPASALRALKKVPHPIPSHIGNAERGLIFEPPPDSEGLAHIGLLHPRLNLGVELRFPTQALPRVAHWQHYGPHGFFASALEVFSGSLLGPRLDSHPLAAPVLQPGETRHYQVEIRVCAGRQQLADLQRHDGPITPRSLPARA